jgi:hypothetical protein
MFKNVKLKSAVKSSLITLTFTAMMVGHSYSQAGGGGGGGGSSGGGGNPGSGTYNGPIGPVPNNANKIAPGGPFPPHPRPQRRTESENARGCVGEQRNSRDNPNQKGCGTAINRVVQ